MILGLVAAKMHSQRLPNKNRMEYRGYPLFWHAVMPLKEVVDTVAVITNDEVIREYCTVQGVLVIPYPEHTINHADAPILEVWRYAHQFMDLRCEMIVTILANCPGHTADAVEEAIEKMRAGHAWEVWCFGDSFHENGLKVFRPHVLNQPSISAHVVGMRDEAFEIHTESDVEG